MAIDHLLHVADIHYWKVVMNPFRLLNKRFLGNVNVFIKRRHEFVTSRATEFSDKLASVGPKNLLMTGDFTSTSLTEEFAMARGFVDGLKDRGLSIQLMPGNHDVYTFGSKRKGTFEEHFKDFIPENGYPTRVTLPGGTPIIMVPTVCPNIISSKGRITDKELASFETLLEQASSQLIVTGHYPVLHQTYGYSSKSGRRLRNAETLRGLMGASGKQILYICGHVHHFSYVQDPEFDNVRHLSSGALFRKDTKTGYHSEFSAIEITSDDFRVIQHRLEDKWKAVDSPVRG